jgi:hypothetical protein
MTPSMKISLFLLAVGIMSCQTTKEVRSENKASIKVAQWLVGEWGSTSSEGILHESWVQNNDSLMKGQSHFIREGDTISSEIINLVQTGDSIYYIPRVKNQNNGQAVKFRLMQYSASTLVFENPSHDFPQMIKYQLISDDSLVAEISGLIKGEYRSEKFPMHKIK